MWRGSPVWFLAALVVAGSAAQAAAQDKRCQLQSYGEIPATMEGRSVTTEAQIDGKPVRLVVDTGAWGTLLFEDQARRLGLALRRTGATAFGVGGETQVYSARVKDFRLGALSERDSDLVVTGHGLGRAQGLLGAKFLLQTDVEFDLPHGKIRFFKPHDCSGDQVVYWGEAYAVSPMLATNTDQILVQVRVNGALIIALMDTGASTSVMTTAAAARLGVTPRTSGIVTVAPPGHGLGRQPVATVVGLFRTFSFGDETIQNAQLRIADLFGADKVRQLGDLIATPVADQPQMLLGADYFGSHRIYISREQHKVYSTYEGGPVFHAGPPPPRPLTPTVP